VKLAACGWKVSVNVVEVSPERVQKTSHGGADGELATSRDAALEKSYEQGDRFFANRHCQGGSRISELDPPTMFASRQSSLATPVLPPPADASPCASAIGAPPADAGADAELRSSDPVFPTLPEVSISPMSSNVRKAQVRAALFHKVEPVRIGRFTLLERLGAGSMGEIYAAYDDQLDRRVALKLVRHGSDLTAKADDLLLREAQALAQVSHSNVVHIYEVGTHDGRLFIAMELIRGQTLTRWLESAAQLPRPLRQREILRRFIAAGRGLEAAHAAGVAHRDFKPDNVVVGEDGRVCVVDFGLARVLVGDATQREPTPTPTPTPTMDEAALRADTAFTHGETARLEPAVERSASDAAGAAGRRALPGAYDEPPPELATDPIIGGRKLSAAVRLTRTGTVMGTPRFMSPEQIRGRVADHRSDQFSFCVALYHALYGEFPFPFTGNAPHELLDSIETGLTGFEHSAGLVARVRKALCRGLSVEPSQRFASMGELLCALEPGLRRREGWIAGAVLLVVAAVGALWFWLAQPADPCTSAGEGIAWAWSAERQAVAQAAFSQSDRPYADAGWHSVKRRMDDYVDRWRDQAQAACRATHIDHVQSDQQLDRRMLCLERGRREVAALAGEFGTGAPDTVRHSVAAAEALADPEACSRAEDILFGLEPPPPALAAEVSVARENLALAVVRARLGRLDEALALARDTRMVTERLSYRPVHAEALVQIANVLATRQNAEARREAESLYFEALDIAEAERHDQLAAAIWLQLVSLAVRMDASTDQARVWSRRAAAAIDRIGNSTVDRAALHHLRGEIDYRDGKYAEAADQAKQAIDAIGPDPMRQLELSGYYRARAKALLQQGALDEASSLFEGALAIVSGVLGASHPDVFELQLNYGIAIRKHGKLGQAREMLETALANMPSGDRDANVNAGVGHSVLSDIAYSEGKLDEAVAQGRTALAIYERAGAPPYRLAEAHTNLANAEIKRKNFAAAADAYREILALRRSLLGADHPQVGITEGSLAEALIGMSRHDEALRHLGEAERIYDPSSAYNPEIQAWLLTVRGRALFGQHQLAAAAEALERALPLFDRVPQPSNQAMALWTLACALHGLGKEPDRAHKLAEQAGAMFAKLGPASADQRDAVERFLGRR
jgi:serine/threonine protein kinase/tetratricopeptide (TPR) repeat protein